MERNQISNVQILRSGEHDRKIRELKKQSLYVIDDVEKQILEIIKIDNPSLLGQVTKKDIPKLMSKELRNVSGNWVFFPWSRIFIKILPEHFFYKLLTSRNKNLIDKNEQEFFRKCKVGIAGLSVGSNIALMIKRQGGSDFMKIADFDDLELTNTNRMLANATQLKLKKSEIVRRQILEINPYSKLEVYDKGLTDGNIEYFFNGVDIIFDEVDDLKTKVKMRELAKKKKIPLIMITDNDDGVLIDYYRFHKDKDQNLFHGLDQSKIKGIDNMTKEEIVKLSAMIVGKENISNKMRKSLEEIGKTLCTWPQLGTAANFAGVIGCLLVRKYAKNNDLGFKRKLVRLNDIV